MKRILWAVGMGIAGLLLGLKGQDTPGDLWWTALIVIWAATIGYGFGSIFDQKVPTRRLVIYWVATLALVGSFFGLLVGAGMRPYASIPQRTADGAMGALTGALFGLLFGTMQLRRLRRKSKASHGGAVA
jgi:hypothetical protein